MDQNRQIRFLIPPFVLFLSLIWGAYHDGIDMLKLFSPELTISVLGIVGAGAVSVIALGFIIGSISTLLLRIVFYLFNKHFYEAVLSEKALSQIWGKLNTKEPRDSKQILYATATFDHELLSKGVHEWLMRRWTSFNISIHSIIAL